MAATPAAASAAPSGLRQLANRLPSELRQPLLEAMHGQIKVFRALRRGLGGARAAAGRLRASAPDAAGEPRTGADIRGLARPGDTLLVIGAPWSRTDYAEFVGRLKAEQGLRFVLLVYDLIPLLRPEWCDKSLVRIFGQWFRTTTPLADTLLAISDATGRDIVAWAEREGVRIAGPVRTLPMGTGFSDAAKPLSPDAAKPLSPIAAAVFPDAVVPSADASLPASEEEGLTARVRRVREHPYALFVSTIEARKNHLLAFRAWRRLLWELPRERVPRLVLAGRVGWLVADLMQQLENANWLDGHVVLVSDPTDAELRALYRGCGFTVFPSLYEGWGLPVTESLSFGKVCVASDRTSVPEAGGPYCLYHDPDSVSEAVALLRRVIEEPELIAGREALLRRDFRPVPWSDAARILVDVLDGEKRDDRPPGHG